jgi:hypothetical protein
MSSETRRRKTNELGTNSHKIDPEQKAGGTSLAQMLHSKSSDENSSSKSRMKCHKSYFKSLVDVCGGLGIAANFPWLHFLNNFVGIRCPETETAW